MAIQYQIPGGPYVNSGGNGIEYQVPGGPYVNEEPAAAAGVFIPILGRGPGMALAGRGGLAA